MKTPAANVGLALGPGAALVVAGALMPVRDDIGTTNIALVLACVVVIGSITGRAAGFATAVVAATSYNFFHTRPYRSLRIHDGKDVLTVALLAVLGVVVGETAHRRRRASQRARSYVEGEHALERVAALLVDDPAPDRVWAEVQRSLVDLLGLADCRFEPGATTTVPVLPHSGSLTAPSLTWDRSGLRLPESGVALAVRCEGRTYGHIVMVPKPGTGTTLDARQVAIALADQFAIAQTLGSATRQ